MSLGVPSVTGYWCDTNLNPTAQVPAVDLPTLLQNNHVTSIFKMSLLNVIPQDVDFVKMNPDFEQFAHVYSKEMAELFKVDSSADDLPLNRFVKIVNKDKTRTVYRKCIARHGVCHDQIALGYRTQQELKVYNASSDPDKEVDIYNSNWFQYYLHNSDIYVRLMFVVAITSIAGFICSLVSLFV